MKTNMGSIDRVLRAIVVTPVAVVIALLVGAGNVLGIVLLVVAAVMLATALAGFCPLYRLLKVNTCSRQKAGRAQSA
jgi:UPF0716 family protein affecting phage T7 exclusion